MAGKSRQSWLPWGDTMREPCSHIFFHFCCCPTLPGSPSEHCCFEISKQKENNLNQIHIWLWKTATAQREIWISLWRYIVQNNFFPLWILPSAYSWRLKSIGTRRNGKWLVRPIKVESQSKRLGPQIKILARIQCLAKILQSQCILSFVEVLFRCHVNAGKRLTWWAIPAQPLADWFGACISFTSLRLFPQTWVLWDGWKCIDAKWLHHCAYSEKEHIHAALSLFQYPVESGKAWPDEDEAIELK